MVTLAQVRTEVGDRPTWVPPQGTEPEIIGTGDGSQTIFGLQYENYIPDSLTVYASPAPAPSAPADFVAVNPSQYTIGAPDPGPNQTGATNATITFNTAPAAGTILGARYQATAFSDDDLNNYLANNAALWPDDKTTLKAVHFNVIPAVISDQRRCNIISQFSYKRDPNAFISSQLKLRDSLRIDLTGSPIPGAIIPALGFGVAPDTATSYPPIR